MSKFIGIGVGPGDPELITLKAIKALENLDVLVVPAGKKEVESEAYKIIAAFVPERVEIVKRIFPMTLDTEAMHHALSIIAKEIEVLVQKGIRVGFVTLGDPMLYSTYGYLLQQLKEQIPTETIPGITSFTAIASGENRILTEGDKPLLIYPCVGELKALEQALLTYDALVLMKVYRSFESVRALLMKLALEPFALVVSNYGKPNQTVHKSIAHISQADISYFTTIIINKEYII